jgi:hypothetical protein
VIFHGLAGHFFLKGVGHVLKVRILADLETRVKLEMERENISMEEARYIIKKDDDERRKWALSLYGIDTTDPSLYDLVIHIRKTSVDDAVEIICNTIRLEHFKTTPESQKALDNLVLAAQVNSVIINKWPYIQVSADDGNVVIHTEASLIQETKICEDIATLAKAVAGVNKVEVHARPDIGSYQALSL